MKKYYKVVDDNYGYYSSARAYDAVSYKEGEWTKAPRNTRLFVFDNLKDARVFRGFGEVIFECEIVGGVKFPGAYSNLDNSKFWEIFNKVLRNKKKVTKEKFKELEKGLAEVDAVLAKKVKILKRVI